MATNYYLSSTDATVSITSPTFSKALTETSETASTIPFTMPAAVDGRIANLPYYRGYAIAGSGVPSVGGTSSGTFTANVQMTTGSSSVNVYAAILKFNSGGSILSRAAAVFGVTGSGTKTGSITNPLFIGAPVAYSYSTSLNNLLDWAKNSTTLVAAANTSTVYTTTTLTSYTARSTGISLVKSVCWDGTQFVAVGSGAVASSPTGATWTVKATGLGVTFTSVAYGGGVYLASATDYNIYKSTDLVNWTVAYTITNTNFYPRKILYGNGVFMVYSANIDVSSDGGTTWTRRDLGGQTVSSSIFFENDKFYTFNDTTCDMYESTNGASWSLLGNPIQQVTGVQGFVSDVAYVAGVWFVTINSSGIYLLCSSTNLSDWYPNEGPDSTGWSTMHYLDNLSVVGFPRGTASATITIDSGTTWASGTRLGVEYIFRNTSQMSSQSLAVGTGTNLSLISAPWGGVVTPTNIGNMMLVF